MEFLMNFWWVHWFLGFGFALVLNFIFGFRNRRWRPFRFGGDNPFAFGPMRRWIMWYTVSFIFEQFTSLFTGSQIYVEFAMSIIEAAALTVGLFCADRLTMLFEPESAWAQEKKRPSSRTADPPPQRPDMANATGKSPASDVVPPLPATTEDARDPAWVSKQVSDIKENIGEGIARNAETVAETAQNAAGDVRKGIFGFLAKRKESADAQKASEEAERQKRRERFDDLTRGY